MATDWTAALHGLTAKAVESYVRFATHSQDLLARIYRGELTPMTLQEQLPGFLSDRGTKFYREFTELSFEFFHGLMGLSSKYSSEYYRGLMPDFAEPEPAERIGENGDLHDWTRWYQVLTARLTEQSQRSAAGYHRLMEKIGRGELSASAVQEYSRRFSQERGADYARDAAELNFRFFDGLLRLNERYNDELFSRLTGKANGAGGMEAVEPVYVELAGPIGSVVSTTLAIENTTGERAEVSCAVSQFRNTDGTGPAFDVPVEIEPSRFSLRAEESQPVTIRVELREGLFATGRTSAATLVVRGQSEQDTLVFLVVKPHAG